MRYSVVYETSDGGVGMVRDDISAKEYSECRQMFTGMENMRHHLLTKIDRDHWFFSAEDSDGTRYYLHVTRNTGRS